MVLSIAAGALLAVAIAEPTPVAASHGGMVHTTPITMHRGAQVTNDQLGIKYTLVPLNCDPDVTPLPAWQTEAPADIVSTDTIGNTTHNLDYRCDWKVHLCSTSSVIAPQNGANRLQYFDLGRRSITLTHNTSAQRFEADLNGATHQITEVAITASSTTPPTTADTRTHIPVASPPTFEWAPCTRVTVVPDTGITSATAANVLYTLTPSNCFKVYTDRVGDDNVYTPRHDASVRGNRFSGDANVGADYTVEPQSNADGIVNATTGAITHLLASDCNWRVQVCYQGSMKLNDGNTTHQTESASSFFLNRSTATDTVTHPSTSTSITRIKDALLYNSDPDKEVDTLRFTATSGCSSAPTVELHDDTNGGSNDDNLTNTLNPTFTVSNIAVGSTVAVTATSADGANTVTKTVSGSQVTGTSVDVMFNDMMCDTQDAGTVANEDCTLPASGNWDISAVHTDTVAGSPASIAYTGITLNIDTVAPTVSFTPSTVTLASTTATSSISLSLTDVSDDFDAADISSSNPSVATAAYSSFGAFRRINLAAMAEGWTRIIVRENAWTDPAGNPNQRTTALVFVGDPSAQPSGVVLNDASDSAPKGDGITNVARPAFTVNGTVVGSTVKVTATSADGATTVTGTATGTATDTVVDFGQDICGATGDQACAALTEGKWTISATHQEASKVEAPLNESAELTLTITPPPPAAPMGVDLDAASDSAGTDPMSDNTDNVTNDNTPSFTVTLPATPANPASVTVTASRDHDNNTATADITVSRTVTGVTTATAAVPFSGDNCASSAIEGESTSESCTLADTLLTTLNTEMPPKQVWNNQPWLLTATWNDGTQDSPASPALEVTIDTVAPTVAVTMGDNDYGLASGATATMTFKTSEPNVEGFDPTAAGELDHLGVTSGEVSAFNDSKAASGEYTATFTASGASSYDYVASVNAGVFTDAAGNANVVSNRMRIAVGRTGTTDTPVISGPEASSVVGDTLIVQGTSVRDATIDITAGRLGAHPSSIDQNGISWSAELDLSRLVVGEEFTVVVRATDDQGDKIPSAVAELSLVKGSSQLPTVSAAWIGGTGGSYKENPNTGAGDAEEAVLRLTSSSPAPPGGLVVSVNITLPPGFRYPSGDAAVDVDHRRGRHVGGLECGLD